MHGGLGHNEPVTPLAVVTAGLELAVVGACPVARA